MVKRVLGKSEEQEEKEREGEVEGEGLEEYVLVVLEAIKAMMRSDRAPVKHAGG